MGTPFLARMSDIELDHYVDQLSPENLPEACWQLRHYCEHIQREARCRADLAPDVRIYIEHLAKVTKAITDMQLLDSLGGEYS